MTALCGQGERFAWLAGIGLLVVTTGLAGCDRGGDRQAKESKETTEASARQEPTARPDADDEASNDTGDAGGSEEEGGKKDWSNKVAKALEKGKQQAAEQDDEKTGGDNCRMFPDNCPDGESCFATKSGRRRCAESNPRKSVGDRCETANDCAAGQQCVGGRPGTCRAVCRFEQLDRWGCRDGSVCTRVLDAEGTPFDWGICRKRESRCSPWPGDTCEVGEACVPTPVGRRCVPNDENARVGDSCRQPTDCRVGQECVVLETGGRECRRKCDVDHPCESGRCAPLKDKIIGFCTLAND